jgi:membrane-associated protease RseP (regulator of RpoE activity)
MKLLLSLFFCVITIAGYAQSEGFDAKIDVHAGYSMPLGQNYPINGGPSIGFEPKFWYNEELVIGAKLGLNFLQSPVKEVKLAPLANVVLVGEKYFGSEDGAALFFVGASAGLYSGGQIKKINGVPTDLRPARSFALAPRAGIQFGPYRLMAEYHSRKSQSKFISIMLGYTFGDEAVNPIFGNRR